ncbi:MAG: hypothetical protein LBQ19_06070, partial [Synergistaceae bacterium]|nr:hypothetical protein [Synergistaceae bacterium]
MRLLGKIFIALLFFAFLGRADAATEWVQLVTDDSEGRVTEINGKSYIIDAGWFEGARKGALYLVYADGREIFDSHGTRMGSYKVPLAVLKVRDATDDYSVCTVAPPSSGRMIQLGDKIIPISRSRAKRMRFASRRAVIEPAPSQTYDNITPGPPARIAPAPEAGSVMAKYDDYWIVPGGDQISAPLAPGYYYIDSPAAESNAIGTITIPAARSQSGAAPAPKASQTGGTPPPYPPYPSYPNIQDSVLDFDANKIADARLIRTFPLSQAEMNSLEIRHRAAWNLYANKRFPEAFDSFGKQSREYRGNYLSPYWAGMSALKMKNVPAAVSWFNIAL